MVAWFLALLFNCETALVADFSTAKWPVYKYIAKDADVYKPPIPFAMLWSYYY